MLSRRPALRLHRHAPRHPRSRGQGPQPHRPLPGRRQQAGPLPRPSPHPRKPLLLSQHTSGTHPRPIPRTRPDRPSRVGRPRHRKPRRPASRHPRPPGQSERTATINIRRLGLEQGIVAHFPSSGDPGVVIAQTPPPNAAGVDTPRVSLLLSEPEEAESPDAFVMPSLTGLTLAGAAARAAAAGLHIASAEDLNLAPPRARFEETWLAAR